MCIIINLPCCLHVDIIMHYHVLDVVGEIQCYRYWFQLLCPAFLSWLPGNLKWQICLTLCFYQLVRFLVFIKYH